MNFLDLGNDELGLILGLLRFPQRTQLGGVNRRIMQYYFITGSGAEPSLACPYAIYPVTSLTLPPNQFCSSSLPFLSKIFPNLKHLKLLSYPESNSEAICFDFSMLRRLEILVFDFEIPSIPATFKFPLSLHSLTLFDLDLFSEDLMSSALMQSIARLTNLQKLSCNVSLDLTLLQNVPLVDLKIVDVTLHRMVFPISTYDNTRLTKLTLTQLNTVPIMSKFSNLTDLALISVTNLKLISFGSIQLKRLRILDSQQQIAQTPLWNHCQKLQSFTFQGFHLSDADFDLLANCTTLSSLSLKRVSSIPLFAHHVLSRLTTFKLHNCVTSNRSELNALMFNLSTERLIRMKLTKLPIDGETLQRMSRLTSLQNLSLEFANPAPTDLRPLSHLTNLVKFELRKGNASHDPNSVFTVEDITSLLSGKPNLEKVRMKVNTVGITNVIRKKLELFFEFDFVLEFQTLL
jgi:hypothetical protein